MNDVKTHIQDLPVPPSQQYEFTYLGDNIDLETNTKEKSKDEKISIGDIMYEGVKGNGVWSKTENGVTKVCLPDALEGCSLLASIDENNFLQINQVPTEQADELK